MRVLELFACSGGATRGLIAAGNEVIATDINPAYLDRNPAGKDPHKDKPAGGRDAPVRQPWEWVQENEGSFSEALDWEAALRVYGPYVDWVWASPPCQTYSVTSGLAGDGYQGLIGPVRKALLALGKPYVIENVPGARDELAKNPVMLCGCMFYGLRVYRPRLFESSACLRHPPHYKHRQPAGEMGRPAKHGSRVQIAGNNSNSAISRAAMGYCPVSDKIPGRQLSESIPPAFAFYIAKEMERAQCSP